MPFLTSSIDFHLAKTINENLIPLTNQKMVSSKILNHAKAFVDFIMIILKTLFLVTESKLLRQFTQPFFLQYTLAVIPSFNFIIKLSKLMTSSIILGYVWTEGFGYIANTVKCF